MSIKNILCALPLLIGSSFPVLAGEFEDGVDAYNRQDYKTALSI